MPAGMTRVRPNSQQSRQTGSRSTHGRATAAGRTHRYRVRCKDAEHAPSRLVVPPEITLRRQAGTSLISQDGFGAPVHLTR